MADQQLQSPHVYSSAVPFTEHGDTSGALRLIDFFLPKTRERWGVEEYRQARITVMTSLLAFATTLIITFFQIKTSGTFGYVNGLSLLGMCFFLGIPIRLKFTGQLNLTGMLLVLISVVQFWLIAYHSAGVFTSILHPLFLVAMIGFLIGPPWLGWFSVSACSVAILSLSFLHFTSTSFAHVHGPQQAAVTALTFCMCFVFCGIVIHFFHRDRLRVRAIALNALDELAEARQEAISANEQKTSFLANMSHELRTPLNAIIGYSEMLEEDFEDAGEDSYRADIHKIHSSAKHLLGLINELLDMSKIEAGKLELSIETFDLCQLVEEITATIEPLARKNQNTLQAQCDGLKETHMTGDPLRVKQILFNLLANACKFTREGTVSLKVEGDGQQVTCQIEDTGIGMSDEQQQRLFQPFEQASADTAKQFGGTGLGLYVSQELCRMMGGQITCESQQNKGTIFTVTLPNTAQATV